jgi:DNA-directed RNA polymerase specialized sigma24 family protein
MVRQQLRQWAHEEATDVIETAVEDALLTYFARPSLYDAGRGHPITWFVAIARNKVREARRQQRRRRARELPFGLDLENLMSSPVLAHERDENERASLMHARAILAGEVRTDQERRFLQARLNGAPIATQAAVLAGRHLPAEQQRRLVHHSWNRLYQRLKRSRPA